MNRNELEDIANSIVTTTRKVEAFVEDHKEDFKTVWNWGINAIDWFCNLASRFSNSNLINSSEGIDSSMDSEMSLGNNENNKERKSYNWVESGHNVSPHVRHYQDGKVVPIPGYYKPTGDKGKRAEKGA